MKKSSFYPDQQAQKIESKIVVALERVSEAYRVLLWNESKENSLSPIQIQILIFILIHSTQKCKVSYLASEFNMTKATISDSVKVLLSKKMVEKEANPSDTRSYLLSLTQKGRKVAKKASLFASSIEQPLEKLTTAQKETMLNGLFTLIRDLNKAQIITTQRMCFNCSFYQEKDGTHFCKLLNQPLLHSEIRMDCAEHSTLS